MIICINAFLRPRFCLRPGHPSEHFVVNVETLFAFGIQTREKPRSCWEKKVRIKPTLSGGEGEHNMDRFPLWNNMQFLRLTEEKVKNFCSKTFWELLRNSLFCYANFFSFSSYIKWILGKFNESRVNYTETKYCLLFRTKSKKKGKQREDGNTR